MHGVDDRCRNNAKGPSATPYLQIDLIIIVNRCRDVVLGPVKGRDRKSTSTNLYNMPITVAVGPTTHCVLATTIPGHHLMVQIKYQLPSVECHYLKQYLPQKITSNLKTLNSQWSSDLCKSSDCTDIELVTECTIISGDSTNSSDMVITIKRDDLPDKLTNTDDTSVTIAPEDLLQQLILSKSIFNYNATVASAVPNLTVEVQPVCPAPLGLQGEVCVECTYGSYYIASLGACALCPIGSYQDEINQTVCKRCDFHLITETVGSTGMNQCKTKCPAGQYFDNNKDRCAPCRKGFYQPTRGLFYCLPCPVDKTTKGEGTKYLSDCRNDCPIGQELGENDMCKACAIGFYKPAGATICEECPPGLVTNVTGADSKDDCNVADNPAGYFRLKDNETQALPCPRGTYQPRKWQYDCISCGGGNYQTVSPGSVSVNDCKFFCPPGEQQAVNKVECEKCPIGFYKQRYSHEPCDQCPTNYITPTTGSTSVLSCNRKGCSTRGQYLDTSVDMCKNCPVGEWQDQIAQTSCKRCNEGYTTKYSGSSHGSDCKLDCLGGQHLVNDQCKPCMKGYYRNKSESWECLQCPPDLTTQTTGAASKDECSLSACAPGKYLDSQTQRCKLCRKNTYQDRTGQSQCVPCPLGFETRTTGATSKSDCKDKCESHSVNCDTNAYCVRTGADVNCTCHRGYIGNGISCTHICDIKDYCKNSVSCSRTLSRCLCKKHYEGDRCQLRTDPRKGLTDKDRLVIATVIPLAILLFVLLIIVYCFLKYRSQPKEHMPDSIDDRTSLGTRLSTGAYNLGFGWPPKPSSIPDNMSYDNPIYSQKEVTVYRV